MKANVKRVLSLFIALVMCVGLLPANAFADYGADGTVISDPTALDAPELAAIESVVNAIDDMMLPPSERPVIQVPVATFNGNRVEILKTIDENATPVRVEPAVSGDMMPGATYSIMPMTVAENQASINGQEYPTFAAALAAAQANDVIKLLDDVTLTTSAVVKTNITLDLNGRTLDLGNYVFQATGNATVKIQNGSINGCYQGSVRVEAGSELTLEKVKLTIDISLGVTRKAGSTALAYGVKGAGKLTVLGEGSEITVTCTSGIEGNNTSTRTAQVAALYVTGTVELSDVAVKADLTDDTYGIYGAYVAGGTLTVNSGSINGATDVGVRVSDGTLNLKGGKITSDDIAVYAPKNGTVNISGGQVGEIRKSEDSTPDQGTYYGVFFLNGSTVNMTGGKVISRGTGLCGNGSDKPSNTKLNISGGTVEAGVVAIFQPQNCVTVISGDAKLTGESVIGIKSGKLTITGGTLTATGEYAAKPEISNSGVYPDGSVIVVDAIGGGESSGYWGQIDIDITGGTLTSKNGHGVSIVRDGDTKTPEIEISGGDMTTGKSSFRAVEGASDEYINVSGGTFSDDIGDYVRDGSAVKGSDGRWTVGDTVSDGVVYIGSTGYETLEQALAAASSGDTLDVRADIALSSDVSINKNVTIEFGNNTLDLGAHKIVVSAGSDVIMQNGSIKGVSAGGFNAIAVDAGASLEMDKVSMDIEMSSKSGWALRVNGNLKLTGDANTHVNITGVSGIGAIAVLGSIEIDGVSVKAAAKSGTSYGLFLSGGTGTMKSGTIDGNGSSAVWMSGAAKLDFNGGDIVNGNNVITMQGNSILNIAGGNISNGDYGILVGNNATVNMTAGSISDMRQACISGNGSDKTQYTTVNLSGGSLESEGVVIYQPQNGETNISGTASLTGDTAVAMKSGKLNISGGTVKGTGTYVADPRLADSGMGTDGSAIVIDGRGNGYYGNVEVSITGGNIQSDNGHGVSIVRDTDENGPSVAVSGGRFDAKAGSFRVAADVPAGDILVTGGSFADDVTDWCDDDHKAVQGEDGRYTIGDAEEEPEQVTVTFMSDGQQVDSQTVAAGSLITAPTGVTKEGFTLDGWFAEGSDTAWDFARDTVTESMTLTARWTEDEPPVVKTYSSTLTVVGTDEAAGGRTFELEMPVTYDGTPEFVTLKLSNTGNQELEVAKFFSHGEFVISYSGVQDSVSETEPYFKNNTVVMPAGSAFTFTVSLVNGLSAGSYNYNLGFRVGSRVYVVSFEATIVIGEVNLVVSGTENWTKPYGAQVSWTSDGFVSNFENNWNAPSFSLSWGEVSYAAEPDLDSLNITLTSAGFTSDAVVGTYPIQVQATSSDYIVHVQNEPSMTVAAVAPVPSQATPSVVLQAGKALSTVTPVMTFVNPYTSLPVDGVFAWVNGSQSWDTSGTHTVDFTFTPSDNTNYLPYFGQAYVTVSPKPVAMLIPEAARLTVVYDGEAHGVNFFASGEGVDADTADIQVSYRLSDSSAWSAEKPVRAGTYQVKAVLADGQTYAGTEASSVLVIEPKALALDFSASSKTYDGTNSADVTVTTNSVIGSDVIELWAANATFNSANVGADRVITFDVVLSGADAGNYKLPGVGQYQTSASIVQRTAHISITGIEKTYGATAVLSNDNFQVVDGLVAGEDKSALNVDLLSGGLDANAPVDEYEITARRRTDANSNYNVVVDNTAYVSVIKADPSIVGGSLLSDGNIGNTVGSASLAGSFVNSVNRGMTVAGTISWSESAKNQVLSGSDGQRVGPYEWTFVPEDSANYNTVTGPAYVTLHAKQVPAVGIWNLVATYDGNPHMPTISCNQEYTVTYRAQDVEGAVFVSDAPVNAGSYDVRVFVPSTFDFDSVTMNTVMVIEKAVPVISGVTAQAIREGRTLDSVVLGPNPTGINGQALDGTFIWNNVGEAPASSVYPAEGQEYGWTFVPSDPNYQAVNGTSVISYTADNRVVSAEIFNLPDELGYQDYAVINVRASGLEQGDVVIFYSDENCTNPVGRSNPVVDGDENLVVDLNGDALNTSDGVLYVRIAERTKYVTSTVNYKAEAGFVLVVSDSVAVGNQISILPEMSNSGCQILDTAVTADDFVSVEGLTVTGVSEGVAVITVTMTFAHPDSVRHADEKIVITRTASVTVISNGQTEPEPEVFTVTFVSDGETVATKYVKSGEKVEFVEITKDGFDFDGWYDGDIKWDFDNDIVTSDVTLEAKWVEAGSGEPDEFTVTFVDGDETFTQDVIAGEQAEDVKREKEGYDFDGWFTDEDVKWDFNNPVESDMTLTAKWTVKRYTITFETFGGTMSVNSMEAEFGAVIVKPEDPTRGDDVFEGWFENENLEGDAYEFTTMPARDFTLYAKWTKMAEPPVEKFTVTFMDDDRVVTTQTVESGSFLLPVECAKEHYTFDGWFTDNGNKWNFDTDRVYEDMTLTAKWTKNTEEPPVPVVYTVVFMDGLDVVDTQVVNAGECASYVEREKEGYTFDGWFNGDDKWDFNTPVTEDMVLLAKWTANSTEEPPVEPEFFIVVMMDGLEVVDTQSVEPGGYLVYKVMSKEGYTFDGWFTDDGIKWDFETMTVNDNFVLNAKWTKTGSEEPPVEPELLTVIFMDGLEVIGAQVVESGSLLEYVDISKDGYEFNGWFTEDGVKWDFDTMTVSDNMALMAKWTKLGSEEPPVEPVIYAVIFFDGLNLIDAQAVEAGHFATYVEMSKEGYDFDGWFTEDGVKWDFETMPVNDHITLMAKWTKTGSEEPPVEPVVYTITFETNGGEMAVKSITAEAGVEIEKPADPTMAGYDFAGWFENEDLSGDAYVFRTMPAKNFTLYAKWVEIPGEQPVEPVIYTITFDAGEGSGTMAPETMVAGKFVLPESKFTAPAGKFFLGWMVNDQLVAVGDIIEVTGNITLVAQYAEIPGSVTPAETSFVIKAWQTGKVNGATIVAGNRDVTVTVNNQTGEVTVVGQAVIYTVDGVTYWTRNDARYWAEFTFTVTQTRAAGTFYVKYGSVDVRFERDTTVINKTGARNVTIRGARWTGVNVTYRNVMTAFLDTIVTGNARDGYRLFYDAVKAPSAVKKYNVTLASVSNGSVTLSTRYAAAGTIVKITAKPNKNYDISEVTATYVKAGKTYNLDLTDKGDGIYTFEMPAYAVKVTVKFAAVKAISVGNIENGKITVSRTTAPVGAVVEVTAKADDGYELGKVTVTYTKSKKDYTVDVVLNEKTGRYEFKMPAYDVVVTATFKAIPVDTTPEKPQAPVERYNITVSEDIEHARVSVGSKLVARDSNVRLVVRADKGYQIDSVSVSYVWKDQTYQVAVTDKGSSIYTFVMPPYDVTVFVTASSTGEDVGENPGDTEEPVEPVDPQPPVYDPCVQYVDVDRNAWYHDAIDYMVDNLIMNGVSPSEFAPNMTLTRGMIVTMLYRLEGEPEDVYGMAFADVDPKAWYGPAVGWAQLNDIVNGYGNMQFGPNDALTREQLVTILYRYSVYKGLDALTMEISLGHYEDLNQVSDWALYPMEWAVSQGVVHGTSVTTLSPKATATRAEVAQMLYNYANSIG